MYVTDNIGIISLDGLRTAKREEHAYNPPVYNLVLYYKGQEVVLRYGQDEKACKEMYNRLRAKIEEREMWNRQRSTRPLERVEV